MIISSIKLSLTQSYILVMFTLDAQAQLQAQLNPLFIFNSFPPAKDSLREFRLMTIQAKHRGL